jgi:MYXO-CTERM domain-containing protein
MRPALAALLVLLPCSALAHAPVVRSAVQLSVGSTLVTVPAFGLVLGSTDAGFSYLCDAALDSPPSELDYPVLERRDGTLLIGTSAGLRLRSAQGCPLPEEADGSLHDTPVSALARAPSGRIYATLAGVQPRLAQSDDDGLSWRTLVELPRGLGVTDLVPVGDEVAVSLGGPGVAQLVRYRERDARTLVSASPDGLRVLAADADTPTVWALVRAEGGVNRGFQLVQAHSLDGPFVPALYVDYFGGFARDPGGVLWVGDAGGHLFRSEDDGASFVDVAPGLGASCVAPGPNGLDACTLSSPTKPALSRYDSAADALTPRLALADVDGMVSCPELDVAARCESAWLEWNRDARLLPSTDAGGPAPDGGVQTDAAPSDGDGAAAPQPASDAAVDSTPSERAAAGCSAAPHGTPSAPLALSLLGLALALCRRRLNA